MNSHYDSLHFDQHVYTAPSSMRKGERPYLDIVDKLFTCEVRLNHLSELKRNAIHDLYSGKYDLIGRKVDYLEWSIDNVHNEIATLRNEEITRHCVQAKVQLQRIQSCRYDATSVEIDFATHGYCLEFIFFEPPTSSAPVHAQSSGNNMHLSLPSCAQVPNSMTERDEQCRSCPLSRNSVPTSEWMFKHPPHKEQSFSHDRSLNDDPQTQCNASDFLFSSPDLVVAPITQITPHACDPFQNDSSGISNSLSPLITKHGLNYLQQISVQGGRPEPDEEEDQEHISSEDTQGGSLFGLVSREELMHLERPGNQDFTSSVSWDVVPPLSSATQSDDAVATKWILIHPHSGIEEHLHDFPHPFFQQPSYHSNSPVSVCRVHSPGPQSAETPMNCSTPQNEGFQSFPQNPFSPISSPSLNSNSLPLKHIPRQNPLDLNTRTFFQAPSLSCITKNNLSSCLETLESPDHCMLASNHQTSPYHEHQDFHSAQSFGSTSVPLCCSHEGKPSPPRWICSDQTGQCGHIAAPSMPSRSTPEGNPSPPNPYIQYPSLVDHQLNPGPPGPEPTIGEPPSQLPGLHRLEVDSVKVSPSELEGAYLQM